MRDFKKLEIWQVGMDIADMSFDLIEDVPWQVARKLIDQAAGSAVSIPSNIAEGNGRSTDKEKHRFMEYSLSSAFELETQVRIIDRRGWSTASKRSHLLEKIELEQKMLTAFMNTLRSTT